MDHKQLIDQVLTFWFPAELDTASAVGAAMGHWFEGGPAVDDEIRRRFGELPAAAKRGELDAWGETAPGRLALLLVIDQFPRNLFAGAEAFAYDGQAQAVALEGLRRGHDRHVDPLQRMFTYLPFEHSESRSLQVISVALFDALREDATDATRAALDAAHDFAVRHWDVIDRFGRYPHRNKALGRPTLPAEAAFLAEHPQGF